MLFIDGVFYKMPLYDGVLLLIVAKSGNGSLLFLAAAWIPVESKLHMAFMVLMMDRAGFDVEAVPWMSDRGNLLAAATILKRANGITLSIKFCLEHIFRNVVHQFKIGKDKLGLLRTAMSAMQASFEFVTYARATDKLIQAFGNETGWKISVYLMSIHPRHWVVFANRRDLSGQA
jgi:hypothetical protein